MRILFVLNNTYNSSDANFNIALTIMRELQRNGHEIIALGNTDCLEVPSTEELNGIQYVRFYHNENRRFILLLRKYSERKYNRLRKAAGLVLHPLAFLSALRYYILPQNTFENKYVENIEKIQKEQNVDIIISVSNPYITALATAKSIVSCKLLEYQLDPHAYKQLLNKKSKKLLYEESYVYDKMDKVLVTDLMYEENKTNVLSKYLNKMEPINFPNIKRLELKQCNNDIVFDKKCVNCVFVGYFYDDIRNPKFILDVFDKLENKNIVLHIVGGGSTELLKIYSDNLDNRLILHGRVPLDNAFNAMLNADILVNVGNTISNQMPSKIFDYISSGKPVVNICKLDDCPTLKYSQKYPLCLELFENNGITNKIIKDFESFCLENKGRKIEFEVIKELYFDCTAECVGQQFNNIINETVVNV